MSVALFVQELESLCLFALLSEEIAQGLLFVGQEHLGIVTCLLPEEGTVSEQQCGMLFPKTVASRDAHVDDVFVCGELEEISTF